MNAAMIKGLVTTALDAVVKRRRPGAYLLYLVARRILWAYNNEDVNIATNGERWLLRRLGRRGLATVFDVGANVGDWVADVLAHAPGATVYCYEAIPTTFAELAVNVQSPRAHLFNAAVSGAAGELVFNASDLSVVSSVYDVHKFDDSLTLTRVTVPAVTGDAECARLGIERIDLLKVDTEGHDLDVLRGFATMIGRGAVDIIQFEYNVFTLLARRGLFDFYDLLSDTYLLCRLLAGGLEVLSYDRGLDTFDQSNWVCVRKDCVTRDLVDLLAMRLPDGHRRTMALGSLAGHPHIAELLA